jgi:hypothetical protein
MSAFIRLRAKIEHKATPRMASKIVIGRRIAAWISHM